MKLLMFIATALLFSFKSVYAHSPVDKAKKEGSACYGRKYTEAELKQNPGQTAKMLRVNLSSDEGSDSIYMDIQLTLQKEVPAKPKGTMLVYEDYENDMYCHTITEGKMECSVFCDGGAATILWNTKNNADDSITFVNEGFVIYGGCGEMDVNGIETKAKFFESVKGNQEFTLYSLPQSFCKAQ